MDDLFLSWMNVVYQLIFWPCCGLLRSWKDLPPLMFPWFLFGAVAVLVIFPAGWHGPHCVRISSEMSPKLHPQPLFHPDKCEILAINPYHDPQAVSFINFPFIPSPFQVRILSINLKVGLKPIPSIPIPWSTLVRYFLTWTFCYQWWN